MRVDDLPLGRDGAVLHPKRTDQSMKGTAPQVVYIRPGQRAVPSPGGEDATKLGCTCPIVDNHYGQGFGSASHEFWITGGCPIHDSKTV